MIPSGQLSSATAGVDLVAARMRALCDALPPDDGVAVFTGVYLTVTGELRRRIADGYFPDRDATAELGTLFANRYLAAVDADTAGQRAPACWRPLLQLRGHRGVRPVQFALAGINAHVGHDLPMAVVDTCQALGVPPHAIQRDFDRVGRMLAALEDRIREELMPGADVLHVGDPLVHLACAWSLDEAREAAWSAAQVLWRLRELPGVYGEFTHRLDTGVGMVSRFLLTPIG